MELLIFKNGLKNSGNKIKKKLLLKLILHLNVFFPKFQPNRKQFGIFCINSYPF